MLKSIIYGNVYGGAAVRGLKRMLGCIMAVMTILGGNGVMVKAVEEKNETAVKYAHELDAQAYTGKDLGATYTKEATVFKVWAPSASGVAVKLYATGSSEEAGAQDISTTIMQKGSNGVWSARVNGDKKNCYYTYLVTVNGVTRETADIYAKAAGVNGNRSMVVDLAETDPDGWQNDKHVLYDDQTDAVVWEVHVKDFSSSEVSGVSLKHKCKYLAFTEKGTSIDGKGEYSTCIEYLKKLSVTHVQLLPVYDYATVDESDTEADSFNWGYDPKNYNVPEGSYSTDPFHGAVRIKEFKQMIMALHNAGIGVIMDVVYNHTFTGEGSWFEKTVPGYYYRMNADGTFSNGSACGNETASDHLMYRKYMIDSILYWTNEYHIDGFRFDLMGVHDITTMNEIRKALDTNVKDGSKVIMYGEPWTGGPLATKELTAVKANIRKLSERIGAFNDDYRDAVKGHVFNGLDKGFIQNGSGKTNLQAAITANTINNQWANQPSQAIAYTSAHDNFTLYDKLVISVKNDMSYAERDEQLVDMNRLAAALTLTSQGITFMQAGEEFARTKYGDENSHASSTEVNLLDWERASEFHDLVSYYSGLIEIRKHYKPFRDSTMTSAKLVDFADTDTGVVAYTLENALTKDKEWKNAAVIVNANEEEKTVELKAPSGKTLPSEWTIIADKYEAGLESLGTVSGNTVKIPARSAMVLADSESFKRLALSSDKCAVRVEYKDADSGEVISKRVYKGSEGDSYKVSRNDSLNTDYDFVRVEGSETGKFTKDAQTVTYYYKKFSGKVVTLNVKYLKEANKMLSGKDEEVASGTSKRIREGSDYSAAVKVVSGYETDMSKFPANAVGKAGNEDINVTYYYKPVENSDLVLHYRSTKGWSDVFAYVYKMGDEKTEYTDKKGDKMQPDSELGAGWYKLSIKDIGSRDDIYVIFSDGKENTDDYFGNNGCKVHGEVWIDGINASFTGKVNVIHISTDGNVLKTEVLSGKTGEKYTSKEGSFENMQLSASTGNTSGEFSDVPVYVIYEYEEKASKVSENNETKKKIAGILGITALVTGAAAVSAAILRKKKKRH